jgi:subfamily B ATP-binding cassette protein MsbA
VSSLARLFGLVRPYRLRLAAGIACMVVYSASSTLWIALIQPFMSVLFSGRAQAATAPDAPGWLAALQATLAGWLAAESPLASFGRLCQVILVLFLVRNLADYAAQVLSVSVEQAAMRDLRRRLFAHVSRLPLSWIQDRRGGEILSRLTNDVEALRGSLAAGISNLLKDGLTLAGCVLWVFAASWRLALFALVVLPPAAWALVLIGRKMRKRSHQVQERMAEMTGVLQENLGGARIVRAFGAERFEEARFERANTGTFRAFTRLRKVSAAAKPLSEYLIVTVAVAIGWMGAREVFVARTLPPEQLFTFVAALLAMLSPVKSLSELGGTVAAGLGAADRIWSVLDTPSAIADGPGARPLGPFAREIRFERVSFAYRPGLPVLRDVELVVKRGEVVALVGASGAGKSTTLDLLARFHDPTSGRITVDGEDLREVTLGSLRGQLGVVSQDTILFHDSVRANIAYGLEQADPAAVERAARAAHAHEFVSKLPAGYDTLVGDRGVLLSGGERQRLAIARALLRNPPILLLDEATSALDAESERLVQEALERLMRDRTVLVIAHRLATVRHADRIVVFEDGRIVQEGRHAELLEAEGPYRRLHALQFREA